MEERKKKEDECGGSANGVGNGMVWLESSFMIEDECGGSVNGLEMAWSG